MPEKLESVRVFGDFLSGSHVFSVLSEERSGIKVVPVSSESRGMHKCVVKCGLAAGDKREIFAL